MYCIISLSLSLRLVRTALPPGMVAFEKGTAFYRYSRPSCPILLFSLSPTWTLPPFILREFPQASPSKWAPFIFNGWTLSEEVTPSVAVRGIILPSPWLFYSASQQQRRPRGAPGFLWPQFRGARCSGCVLWGALEKISQHHYWKRYSEPERPTGAEITPKERFCSLRSRDILASSL